MLFYLLPKGIEQIIDVERFIDLDYYQVAPVFIEQDAKSILKEVIDDVD